MEVKLEIEGFKLERCFPHMLLLLNFSNNEKKSHKLINKKIG